MKFIISMAVLALAGCATTGANRQADIDYAAGLSSGSHLCVNLGFMDQETAAKGIAYANSRVYSSETSQYQARARYYATKIGSPTQQHCNDIRLHILTRVDSRAQAPAASSQAYQPRYTNCSTYFGQTHCTTF